MRRCESLLNISIELGHDRLESFDNELIHKRRSTPKRSDVNDNEWVFSFFHDELSRVLLRPNRCRTIDPIAAELFANISEESVYFHS